MGNSSASYTDAFDAAYEVDEDAPLGTGKFGVVSACWHRGEPDQRFALKEILTQGGDTSFLARIRNEITVLQLLGEHPHLVSLIDVDESSHSKVRLVLELCDGGELYDRIQFLQSYPEQDARLCCYNLMEACTYIHSKRIMHRDLKPENILMVSTTSHTDIKISDFGLAKLSREPNRLPRSHSICGSDFYLAPEVIKQEEYGREIDIWALGVITYVLLSGSLPFFHEVLHKLYRQIVERDLGFPEQVWKNVSKGALDFILQLLQVRAGDRLTADRALCHPWLRGANGDASFSTLGDQNILKRVSSNGNSSFEKVDGRAYPQRMLSMALTPHPLHHAKSCNEQQPSRKGGKEAGSASSRSSSRSSSDSSNSARSSTRSHTSTPGKRSIRPLLPTEKRRACDSDLSGDLSALASKLSCSTLFSC